MSSSSGDGQVIDVQVSAQDINEPGDKSLLVNNYFALTSKIFKLFRNCECRRDFGQDLTPNT